MLAVPIVLFSAERFQFSADKLQGVINVQTIAPREFTQEEISFVETAAGELAFFIANAQLYQQTDERLHQKLRELTTLQQVSKLIAEQIGLHDVIGLLSFRWGKMVSSSWLPVMVVKAMACATWLFRRYAMVALWQL
jgi:GAF domain-containing protein